VAEAEHHREDAEQKQIELGKQLTNALRELNLLSSQNVPASEDSAPVAAAKIRKHEYELKAAILYHVIEYVGWPEVAAGGDTTVIGLLGGNPFGETGNALNGKIVKGRKLIIKEISEPAEYAGCWVIFISGAGRDFLPQILDGLKGKPILTVADAPGFAERGVMVNLVAGTNRVVLEINQEAATRAGLTFSSQLLGLAKIVK
jgi:hypothetical protein